MHVDSSDGVSIAVHDLGGAGPPLIVAHATGFCGRAYEPFAAALADLRHVWAFDFRGHGDSTSPANGRFDWGGSADDLLAVIDAIADGPVDLVGHSMGGGAAALAEQRRPGCLRSAYLFEPIIVPAGPDEMLGGNFMAQTAAKRRDTFPSFADALLRYAAKTPLAHLNAGALADYVQHGFAEQPDGSVRLKLTPAEEAAVFDAGGKPTTDTAAAMHTPVTVAVGAVGEGFSPARFGALVVDALPDGHLVSFADLGHFGPLEAPTTVAADVARWLASQ